MKKFIILLLVFIAIYVIYKYYSDTNINFYLFTKEGKNAQVISRQTRKPINSDPPSNKTSNNVTLIDREDPFTLNCNDFVGIEKKGLKSLRKREQLLKKIARLEKSSFTKIVSEKLYQLAGGDLEEFRIVNSWHGKYFHSDLKPVNKRPVPLDPETATIFFQSFLLREYDKIISLIESERLDSNSIYNGQSILSFIITNQTDIESTVIERFIDAGLHPNFTDIANATRVSASRSIIETLLKESTFNLRKTWYENYKKYSLSILAAENLDYELFYFWENYGSPLVTTKDDYTVLDVLPSPNGQEEKDQLIKIFEIAASQGIEPYKIGKIEEIKKWLPQELTKEYESYFHRINENNKNNLMHTAQKAQIEKILNYINELNRTIASYEQLSNKCGFTTKFNNTQTKPNPEKVEIKNHDHLKKLVDIFNRLEKDDKEQIIKITDYLKKGEWDSYIKLASEMNNNGKNNDFFDLLLNQAIGSGAPTHIVTEMLNDGATLNKKTIFTLIRTDNLDLAKELLQHGLDLTSKNSDNLSPIQYSRQLGRKRFTDFIEHETLN